MIPQISGEKIGKLISCIRKLSNLMKKYILE